MTIHADAGEFLVDPRTLERRQLTVVMPVYNEVESLPACAASWLDALSDLDIDHRLLIIDDGSRDQTVDVLDSYVDNPDVVGVSKDNEGHGPTILRGYRLAARTSDWVFQVDSDDEIPASAFADVWEARADRDAVFGIRTGREQSPGRKVISRVAAITSRLLLGGRVTDVNVPFRLMRADVLLPVVDALPPDTFAPNVVISGVLGRNQENFTEVPVPHHERKAGQVSIIGFGALEAAARSFLQTVRLSWSLR